jgi:DOPA 4,5-dioxygenase
MTLLNPFSDEAPPQRPELRIVAQQVAFAPDQFAALVSWLMLHRDDLDVLVYPEAGDDLVDHRDHALWLGEKLALDFSTLGRARTA